MTDPTVRAQVRAELKDYAGPLKAAALRLAKAIDEGKPGMAGMVRELRATLREIELEHFAAEGREREAKREAEQAARAAAAGGHDDEESDGAPAVEEADPVADIAAARARRLATPPAG